MRQLLRGSNESIGFQVCRLDRSKGSSEGRCRKTISESSRIRNVARSAPRDAGNDHRAFPHRSKNTRVSVWTQEPAIPACISPPTMKRQPYSAPVSISQNSGISQSRAALAGGFARCWERTPKRSATKQVPHVDPGARVGARNPTPRSLQRYAWQKPNVSAAIGVFWVDHSTQLRSFNRTYGPKTGRKYPF